MMSKHRLFINLIMTRARTVNTPLQVNIEQDPEIIDTGFFGADDDFTFHRFEFNDYPSEVFFPNNDYYNADVRNVDDDEGDDVDVPTNRNLLRRRTCS